MFVGRTGLLRLVDRLTEVPARGVGNRPVLVVEGCGGSGRTALLNRALANWRDRTATVLVSPSKLENDENRAVRPVLAAVVLGLGVGAPGYRLTFERVLLAELAIATDVDGLTPEEALDELRARTNSSRRGLEDLIHSLVGAAGELLANVVPGGPAIPPLLDGLWNSLRESKRGARLAWSREALAWFGHQDQGLGLDGERVRLQLSVQARNDNPGVRREVDDLLVAALLADLRHSLARATGRPANVLVLLDDGDTSAASSFTGALLRVRRAVADTHGSAEAGTADPLTLVTTSGGTLAGELAGELPPPVVVEEENAATAPLSGMWLRVSFGDLRPDNVVQLAKNHLWPDHLAARSVAAVVHRLTRGHAESTAHVLRRLHDEPQLIGDLDRLLRRDGPTAGVPMHRHLLRPFVRGHRGRPGDLLDALVTLSAAHDRLEAQELADLLPEPITLDSPLFTHPTLWTGPAPEDRLHPLVRYLGLRALADTPDRWAELFGRLRARARDETAELRHARLLGERGAVAARLVELLPVLPTDEWLARFDVITEEPDPRERDLDVVRGVNLPKTPEGHAYRLLGAVPAVDHDPCWTEEDAVSTLCVTVAQAFRQLSEPARDSAPLLERARDYDRRRGITW
ncbi:hypothetical protein [Saccharothrix sp. Mg75]|uniref:hypothetical protein n=1 Tax=Saccharothrix sp. Mg75 TaxID=3445357 RepID=UPI003EEC7132